jgi:hypothetical protein
LTLKNNLSKFYSQLSPQTLAESKQIVVQGLSDPEKMIRNTCGSIITDFVKGGNIQRWPEVLPKLLELLNFKETIHGLVMGLWLGSLSALTKICEDSSLEIDSDPQFVEEMVCARELLRSNNMHGRKFNFRTYLAR